MAASKAPVGEIVADAVPGLAVAAAPAAAVPVSARHEIASNDQPLEVGHEPVTTQVTLADEAPQLVRAFDEDLEDEGPHRVILQLDGIVTKNPPGNYEIYLNHPEVDRDTGVRSPTSSACSRHSARATDMEAKRMNAAGRARATTSRTLSRICAPAADGMNRLFASPLGPPSRESGP